MILFLQHDKIDILQWDNCISRALNGNLYGYSWYLDIVSPGWCALVEGEYENVFPLPTFRKAGINYMMQPYFTQQLGLFGTSLFSNEQVLKFLDSIPKQYRYIDFNLNTANYISGNDSFFDNTNLELNLNFNYETIAAGYQTNLQRNLKKAGTDKLAFVKNVNTEDLITLFRANKGLELKHLSDKQYNIMRKIANKSIEEGLGEIWGAYDQYEKLVAGILWITSHQKSVFLFSALSETGKSLHAMPWLIDLFIRLNAGKPVTLDFEGSNNEGLARFYGSFGAQKVLYQRYKVNSLPFHLHSALNLWRFSKGILKK
jgi:hypothetical protein